MELSAGYLFGLTRASTDRTNEAQPAAAAAVETGIFATAQRLSNTLSLWAGGVTTAMAVGRGGLNVKRERRLIGRVIAMAGFVPGLFSRSPVASLFVTLWFNSNYEG